MKVAFLDRDGVINEYPGDFQYVTHWENFRFLPNVKSALKKLNQAGFKIFVISNQAGVSKGVYSQENLDLITKNMLEELNKHGVSIEQVFYCIHRPEDNCNCRKPKTGNVEAAVAKLEKEGLVIDKNKSFFIGDTIRDIETGKAAGLSTILIFSGKEKPENKNNWATIPDFTAHDLTHAVEIITKKEGV